MRQLQDEDYLVDRLRAAADKLGVALSIFDANGMSVRQQAAVFRMAKVVVGIHGAALTNIVFCEDDVLVAELGFKGSFTDHYAHAAAALGYKYKGFQLDVDERGEGSPQVQQAPGTFNKLVKAVMAHLEHSSSTNDEL